MSLGYIIHIYDLIFNPDIEFRILNLAFRISYFESWMRLPVFRNNNLSQHNEKRIEPYIQDSETNWVLFLKKGCTVMYILLLNIIQFQNIKQYQWKHLNHDIFHTHYFSRRVPFATIAVEGDNLFIFSYFFTYEHCNCIFEILNWGVKKSKYHFFCPYYIQTTWHANNFQIPVRKKNLP